MKVKGRTVLKHITLIKNPMIIKIKSIKGSLQKKFTTPRDPPRDMPKNMSKNAVSRIRLDIQSIGTHLE